MGHRPLPSAVLRAADDSARLGPDALYAVVGVVSSAPDLDSVLAQVVALLTDATDCHACFVYLRHGESLHLRAASPIYAHLVGKLAMGIDEGLAGWAARTSTSAFIREDALADPRFHFVPELEEERFQSMVAVPLPARDGDPLGVVVLHTEAPREFDENVLTLLEHTASLVSGAIENSQLLDHARRRVSALTALTALGERISAATEVEQLSQVVTEGLRGLVHADACLLHLLSLDGRSLSLAAVDPPDAPSPWATASGPADLAALLRTRDRPAGAPGDRLLSAVIAAGEQTLGTLSALRSTPFSEDEHELVRTVASHAAVALKRIELIDRLTGKTGVRHVLDALEAKDVDLARARGRSIGLDLGGPFLALVVELAAGDTRSWGNLDQHLEQRLRREAGALVDLGPTSTRGLVSLGRRACQDVIECLDAIATEERVAIGVSWGDPGRGDEVLREAADACLVSRGLGGGGGTMAYGELGAYRFLIRLPSGELPFEHQAAAVKKLIDYDSARKSELLLTLEQFLRQGRSLTSTARSLIVHPNTLRQRLDRIEQVTGLSLADEDLLALELTIKAARLRSAELFDRHSPSD